MPTASLTLGTAAAAAAAAVVAYRMMCPRKRKIIITGGCGNLGTKLALHLLGHSEEQYEVVLLEKAEFYKETEAVAAGAKVVLCDLADGNGQGWRAALKGADALIHFSAVNPYPNATWADAAGSMAHTFNVFQAALQLGVRRVVLASSNHVMGQYKEKFDHGLVKPTDPPACGTPLRDLSHMAASGDAIAYAAAKLAGEELAKALSAAAAASGNARTSFYILRIGWCQPGENSPRTLSAAGVPPEFQTQGVDESAAGGAATKDDVDGDWFKSMWLSNGDFCRYFEAAILRPPPVAGDVILVNAMSNNRGMRWSLAETQQALGVAARDDSRA
jgi:nucleoside-diphosphate-sugar epimerase